MIFFSSRCNLLFSMTINVLLSLWEKLIHIQFYFIVDEESVLFE